jgi:uncharacterized damage-inducible protein DinB
VAGGILAEDFDATGQFRVGKVGASFNGGYGGDGENPRTNLFAKIPHGEGQTVLREAVLLADHNAYHLGQFVLVLRALGAWKET